MEIKHSGALCKNQSFDDQPEGQQQCMPIISDFPSSTTWDLTCITSPALPQCDQDRRQNVVAMGCPECEEAALEGDEVQFICRTAQTEEKCRQVNPGGPGTFKSGSIPEDLKAGAVTSACPLQQITRGCVVGLITSGLVSLLTFL